MQNLESPAEIPDNGPKLKVTLISVVEIETEVSSVPQETHLLIAARTSETVAGVFELTGSYFTAGVQKGAILNTPAIACLPFLYYRISAPRPIQNKLK